MTQTDRKNGNRIPSAIRYCKSRIKNLESTKVNAPTQFGRNLALKFLILERRKLKELENKLSDYKKVNP